MTVYICREFILDLAGHADRNFSRRVLAKTIAESGGFEPDANDHTYDGIEKAWIRYVSGGSTAYRAIFIRDGEDIYWYRAGEHSVEDHLAKPKDLKAAISISSSPVTGDVLGETLGSRYLKSSHPKLLRQLVNARRLIPHRNVLVVSPTLSPSVIAPTGDVGRLIDSVLEFGGSVSVMTRSPSAKHFSQFEWLAARGVDLLIHPNLNARMLYFEVNQEKLSDLTGIAKSIAVVGSAEMTEGGLNLNNKTPCSEELCYEIAEDDIEGSMEFFLHLADLALPFEAYRATVPR